MRHWGEWRRQIPPRARLGEGDRPLRLLLAQPLRINCPQQGQGGGGARAPREGAGQAGYRRPSTQHAGFANSSVRGLSPGRTCGDDRIFEIQFGKFCGGIGVGRRKKSLQRRQEYVDIILPAIRNESP